MYRTEKQTSPSPHLTTPFSAPVFIFEIFSRLFVYRDENTPGPQVVKQEVLLARNLCEML